ncbi:MAG: hypothetical protein ACJ79K_04180 [Gemmatimonadaceae bacterium]
MRNSIALLLLGVVTAPGIIEAQRSIDIEPIVGLYAPVGSYDHAASYFRVGTPESPRDNAGTAFGANARLWIMRNFGVQLQGVTSTADHQTVATPGGGAYSTSSRVTALTAQLLYSPSLPARARVWIGAGGGTIKHGGTAYAAYGTPSRAVIALGAGGSIPIWRGLSAGAGIDGLFYNWELSDAAGTYQGGTETDLVAHLGLSLTVR